HSHGHSHGHSHEHAQDHHPDNKVALPHANNCEPTAQTAEKVRRNEVLRKLKLASYLCFTFFLVEVIGGFFAGSLAVLSDAVHLAADLAAFLVAIVGSHIASLPASESHTFGLKRTESLAALLSMVCLVILSIGLAVEATHRIWVLEFTTRDVTEVDGKLMSTIAAIGVIVNVILAFVLGEDHAHMPGMDHGHCHDHEHGDHNDHNGHSHSHHNHDEESNALLASSCQNYSAASEVQHLDELLPDCEHDVKEAAKKGRNVNLHAAYTHVMADLAQSVVVLIAGLIIWMNPTWQLTDPICTLIFSIMVCYSTIGVIRSSLSVLLEEVPPGVNYEGMYDAISSVEGVSNVHDLHIWSISHGHSILSVHGTANDVKQAYHDIKTLCNQKNISHLTVQLQPRTIDGCVTCSKESEHLCR
ncbi:hypothetical protein ACHAXH_001848, partial [Discostella pseudostelligera]